ncbi:hypothetical protein SRS16P2_00416 (plasmid) [Variovorax sp. SRS16]|uniref:CoxG family protein n=1 Tax=Variovorax sp. SRS16 TaxID=282217 RepID=UPI0013187B2E|nr:SRPBCC domain-containing protein [Variovorax sp. SRS16]VTU45969.1 hypothetical protein SRS16P2_00416 [Variovorax sp. SRS16]
MDFRIDATLPASAAQLWSIFFDVQRVAQLIPGCENVTEVEPLKEFSALMKQKLGPFKLELPTTITLGAHTLERYVELSASGRDKFTGTTLAVNMKVNLEERHNHGAVECLLSIDADMQVAGKLASLGYPVVKKRSEELFADFEKRLRNELAGIAEPKGPVMAPVESTAPVFAPTLASTTGASVPQATPAQRPALAAASAASAAEKVSAPHLQHAYFAQPQPSAARPSRGVELVLQWPRVGVSVAVACVVAYAATTAFQQSPGWWLVAPLLGVAAGLGRRSD